MADPIVITDKFVHAGVTTVLFVPEIGDVEEPARSELDAGTDLTEEVVGASGWQLNSNRVTYQPLGTKFTPSIAGRTTVDDSSLTLPQSLDGDDVREVLPRGTKGYIVIMHAGFEDGLPMDVWPVEVSSHSKPVSTESNEIANIVINFAIPAAPAEDVSIPAEE